jgi:hypothetical protein
MTALCSNTGLLDETLPTPWKKRLLLSFRE